MCIDCMKKIVKRVLPILLAIALLAYALKDISFPEMILQFQKANYIWVGFYSLTALLTYYLRGKRWQQPLLALGHNPSAFRTTIAFQAGMTASMILVGSGELTRCATLQKTDNIPFSHSIGSIIAERIIDMIMLLVILLLAFLLELSRMKTYITALRFSIPGFVFGVAVAVGILLVITIYKLSQKPIIRNNPLIAKAVNFTKGIWQGFSAIRHLPNPALFIMLTLLIQVMGWLSTYVLLHAVPLTQSLPPTAALTILAVASLGGLAVPTQGGIGTYHFLVSRALILYRLSTSEGALVATFTHAVGFSINLLISSVSFLIIPILIQRQQTALSKEATT